MRNTMFKGINILGNLLNLGLLIFFMWGSAVYAPNSNVTLFIWLVGFVVFIFCVFEIIWKISNFNYAKRYNR